MIYGCEDSYLLCAETCTSTFNGNVLIAEIGVLWVLTGISLDSSRSTVGGRLSVIIA